MIGQGWSKRSDVNGLLPHKPSTYRHSLIEVTFRIGFELYNIN